MRVFLPISGNKPYEHLCRQYPDNLGYIIGPSYFQKPKVGIPFVLDNDAFKCWKEGTAFNQSEWFKMIRRVEASGQTPLWMVVPDAVCDRDQTLRNWEKYHFLCPEWPKAFVLQDGMTMGDVPKSDIYFVGGSTEFKWNTAHVWCKHLPRVHIGRVRSRRLEHCERIGAESCDGSGWLRETVRGRPFRQLEAWLEGCNYQHEMQLICPN